MYVSWVPGGLVMFSKLCSPGGGGSGSPFSTRGHVLLTLFSKPSVTPTASLHCFSFVACTETTLPASELVMF